MIESRKETRRKRKARKETKLKRLIVLNTLLLVTAGTLGYGIWYAGNDPEDASPSTERTTTAANNQEASEQTKPVAQDVPDQVKRPENLPDAEHQEPEKSNPSGPEVAEPDSSKAPNPSSSDQALIHMNFVGDILLAGTVEDRMMKEGWNTPYIFVKDVLSKADITVGNLETPVTKHNEPQKKSYVFKSSPDALPALKDAGFDVLSLANNHILDQGRQGLLDTMEAADEAGFERIGAGKNVDEAYKPVMMTKQGVKVAFVGLSRVVPEGSWKAGPSTPGVAETYDTTRPLKEIRKADQTADLVVVVVHWGKERQEQPADHQQELAHAYIDAGADLVIGAHPHVLQGFEQYKGKWIAYSLGNFIFTTNSNPKTWDTGILETTCTKKGSCALKLIPVLTKYGQPKLMDAVAGSALRKRISDLSKDAAVDAKGIIIAD
ncbi:hypothetical protein SY83_20770 [Paenibacillus swuensis]|uniref:Capsule synthesis protein CapA domain-containing protein n=1 Tax=Paenibacillus swuensis TaxID=1178515 RepID=A0A172TN50_9BACL|nr:CapA family protein [Paenibacillus swuensis]ANE48314.1 hypothetical protein SY83_20770 [Paenibacillus swuensis]